MNRIDVSLSEKELELIYSLVLSAEQSTNIEEKTAIRFSEFDFAKLEKHLKTRYNDLCNVNFREKFCRIRKATYGEDWDLDED